jgi:hypothetical protein
MEMWCVVDSNQAWHVDPNAVDARSTPGFEGLTVPVFVVAELLLIDNPTPRRRLAEFKFRFGLEPAVVLSRLAELSSFRLPRYQPFADLRKRAHWRYRDLEKALKGTPRASDLEWARRVKSEHRSTCGRLAERAMSFRKAMRDAASRGFMPSDTHRVPQNLPSRPLAGNYRSLWIYGGCDYNPWCGLERIN